MQSIQLKALLFAAVLLVPVLLFAEEEGRETSARRLLEAAEEGDLREVHEWIEKGAPVNARDEEEGTTPLIAATLGGHVEVVKALIQAKADVNLGDHSNDATPVMWAATLKPDKEALEKGHTQAPPPEKKLEIAKLLIRAGAAVNRRNAWGGTSLQWASDEGNIEMVKLLLSAKADPNIADDQGLSPLMAAVNYEGDVFLQIARALIAAGAKLEATNKNGETAMMYAVNPLTDANVRMLIESKASVNAADQNGITVLMKACQYGRAATAKALIAAGARIDARTKDGRTVLRVARDAGFQPTIQVLLDAGAKE